MTGEPGANQDEYQAAMYDARLAEQDQAHPGYRNAWQAFEAKLLQHGGRRAVPPLNPDQLVTSLSEHGEVLDGSAVLSDEQDEDCHRNAAALWRSSRCDGIGTGYALSDDGLWREHSWAMRDGLIVETTVPRVRYFGILMTGEKASWFADWVSPSP